MQNMEKVFEATGERKGSVYGLELSRAIRDGWTWTLKAADKLLPDAGALC